MSQHDYNVANASGASIRTDFNNVLAAIVSQNSGSTEPTTTFAFMNWVDTSGAYPILKIRNAADSAWLTVGRIDVANFGLLPLTGGQLTGALTFTNTDSMSIPSGTTAQRPGSPAAGMIRYNTDTPGFEVYYSSSWLALRAGSVDLSNQVTGTLPATSGGTAQSTYTQGDMLYASAANTLAKLAKGTTGQYLRQTSTVPAWETPTLPTIQRFTSGSGTYTTPAGVKYIKVKMVGGGGGGGGGNAVGAATSGGSTTFGSSLLTAAGGTGGTGGGGNGPGGAGGAATIASPAISVVSVTGTSGANGGFYDVGSGGISPGGLGGMSVFGGAGSSGYSTTAGSGLANSGSGGGGGAANITAANNQTGGGGGAGAYVEAIITSPSSTYAYAIGAGGAGQAGSTNGHGGGAGGSGVIIVEEYYL